MGRQINLDSWQSKHMLDLLRQGSLTTASTGRPLELYRKTIEEQDDCYKELVYTLTHKYVIEQTIISGGPLPPSLTSQLVYNIAEYPQALLKKSQERYQEIASILESIVTK